MINSISTDFLIRLKNGFLADRREIMTKYSKMCENAASLLKKEGFIVDYTVVGDVKKEIKITLTQKDSISKFNGLELFSKPGRRMYEKHSSLPWGRSKNSLIIISTSAGLMTQKEASAKKMGGEIIAEIW